MQGFAAELGASFGACGLVGDAGEVRVDAEFSVAA